MTEEHEETSYTLRIGSLVLHNVGQLLPHQLQSAAFHNQNYIYPVCLNMLVGLLFFYCGNLGRLYGDKILLVYASSKSSLCISLYNSRYGQ